LGHRTMATTVTTRLDDKFVEIIDQIAVRKGVDRSAVLRSFLLSALKEHNIDEALERYQAGKITLWEAASACDLSLWEMVQEIQERHVHCYYGVKELEKDLRGL
jgi:predicted HTH domain antitoxin